MKINLEIPENKTRKEGEWIVDKNWLSNFKDRHQVLSVIPLEYMELVLLSLEGETLSGGRE